MLDVPERVTRAYNAALAAAVPPAIIQDNAAAPVAPVATGTARLLEVVVSADGVTGRRLMLRAGGSDLAVTVRFQADPLLPPPSVAFWLETMAGGVVSSGSTHFDGILTAINAQNCGQVRLAFPRVPLMRGEYRLTVFLACESTLHVYDQAAYCAELEVTHDSAEQGVVFLPHHWETADE